MASPPEALVGKRAHVDSPTMRTPLAGSVVAVDGYAVSVEVSADLVVAVDFEDCWIID